MLYKNRFLWYIFEKQIKRLIMAEKNTQQKKDMFNMATGIVDLKFLQGETEEAEKIAAETAAKIDKAMQAKASEK